MKRSLSIMIILLFLMSSCAVQQIKNNEYIKVYKKDRVGEMLPMYLIIKPLDKTYDLYFAWGHDGVLGSYKQYGDTLVLTPKYSYGSIIKEVETEITITSIPILLKIKGNILDDITQYKNYPELSPWFKNGDVYNFRQMK